MDRLLEQLRKLEINMGDVKPSFVNYRNPQDDKIQQAIQEAAKQLKAEGKPLVKGSRRDATP